MHTIERVLIEHIEVLQSMSPQDFLAFRALLTPASGFQSVFCALLETNGYPMQADEAERRLFSLVAMAHDHRELFAVSEGLLDHDGSFSVWRHRHVLMVEREIGAKRGTGGSGGVDYLRSTLDRRCFPQLWGLRSHL